MEHTVKRFARNILLLHVALLAVVLAVVLYASRTVERSAREQAIAQAKRRQELLASQTARGIENFYKTILSDMDLLPRDEEDRLLPNLQTMSFVTPRPRRGARTPANSASGLAMGKLLGRQLEDRISHLFVVEKKTMLVQYESVTPADEEAPTAGQIVDHFRDWLKRVEDQSVSSFAVIQNSGLSLVCLPTARDENVLVAVVPVRPIELEFLEKLNDEQNSRAYLLDESLAVVAASRSGLIGAKLSENNDPQVQSTLASLHQGTLQSGQMSQPFHFGPEQFEPAMLSATQIEVLPGRKWSVLISTPLSQVDHVVKGLFDKVFWWATFVTASITAILVSTAFQLIRSRVRMEKTRRATLEREMKQARKIQLAWLPQKMLRTESIDIAATNQPASHISGDFYNWFELPDGRTAIVIGDVTGHGMSAAFLMATSQLLVRTTLQNVGDPGLCLEEVNRQLCLQVFNGQFVTMQILVFDPKTGELEIATAGHPNPFISDDNGRAPLRPLDLEPQWVLGIEPDAAYPTEKFNVSGGASILLYTDGVTDVQGTAGKRLRADGIQKHVTGPFADATALLDQAMKAITTHRGGSDLSDDLTIVAVSLAKKTAEKPALVGAR